MITEQQTILAFEERTPREVRALIKNGAVNGLMLFEDEIVLDCDGFFQNIMCKVGVGRYEPMTTQSTKLKMADIFNLAQVIDNGHELVYEVVSNRCQRLPLKEEAIRKLYNMGALNGCFIMENTGLIEFGKNVLFTIDRNGSDEKTSVAWDDVAEFFDEPTGEDMVAVLMPEEAFEDISEEVAEIDTSVERVPEAAEAEAEAPKKATKPKGSKKKK